MNFKDKVQNIAIAYSAMIIYSFVVYGLFKGIDSIPTISSITAWSIFGSLIFAPFVEEIIYRFCPIEITRHLGKQFMLPVVLLTSAIFGWMHGSIHNVLIQGVYGAIFAWVYIKNDYSYLSSVFIHFLWNFTVLILTLII